MIIEIAGIDGCGKSTQIERLQRISHEHRVPCYERSLRSTGRRILSGIAAQRGHSSWSAMFDRGAVELATAVEMYQLFHSVVVPIQFPGQLILTDTYVRSWLAVALAENAANLDSLAAVYAAFPAPDLSIQLDCEVDEAYRRILARPKGDHILRHGGKARLERLARAYGPELDRQVRYPTIHLAGDRPVEAVAKEILDLVLGWAATHDPVLHGRLSSDA